MLGSEITVKAMKLKVRAKKQKKYLGGARLYLRVSLSHDLVLPLGKKISLQCLFVQSTAGKGQELS